MTAAQQLQQPLVCVAAHINATAKFTRTTNLTCMIVVNKDLYLNRMMVKQVKAVMKSWSE
jgi:hypothetical protein